MVNELLVVIVLKKPIAKPTNSVQSGSKYFDE